MNTVVKIVLALLVAGLAYVTWESVARPVRFDKIQLAREEALQKQLKRLTAFEEAYENRMGRFANEEELRDFLLNGSVYYVYAEGDYTEAMREQGLTEAAAAARGLIKRDTIWVRAIDSLLHGDTNIDPLFTIPGTDKKVNIQTGEIDIVLGLDTIKQPVFEITASYRDYLSDLDESIIREKEERAKERTNGFPGLRIGSLTEVKKTGNWE